MSQNWHSEYMLILVALLIVTAFGICYTVPGLLGAFSYITTSFFLFAGVGIIAFGCLKLYDIYRNN